MSARLGAVTAAVVLLFAASARADDAGAPSSVNGCVETMAQGAARPLVTDTIDPRGRSGYASVLVVRVEHGKGESVLPGGLELQTSSDAAKLLRTEGWVLPEQDGSGGAHITSAPLDAAHPDRIITTLELPLVALPKDPGRHVLTLPPLPIAIARASGEVSTACTHTHRVTIDDPTAEATDPEPKPNPPPMPQREEWTAMKRGVLIGTIGIVVGALAMWLLRRWQRRPRPAPPAPPPRPPWEVALERIDEIRHAGLLDSERYGEYFDRVNDAVRWYLGARYGFEGLESTTDETIHELKQSALAGVALEDVVAFLADCDLVKFANATPAPDDCARVIEIGERIVRATTPPQRPRRTKEAPR